MEAKRSSRTQQPSKKGDSERPKDSVLVCCELGESEAVDTTAK